MDLVEGVLRSVVALGVVWGLEAFGRLVQRRLVSRRITGAQLWLVTSVICALVFALPVTDMTSMDRVLSFALVWVLMSLPLWRGVRNAQNLSGQSSEA